MTTIVSELTDGDLRKYDYIVVGGGTAGCIIATRLAEYLPQSHVLLVEAGPSDYNDTRISDLKNWIQLLGTELDYDYSVAEQPRGKHDMARKLVEYTQADFCHLRE